MAVNRLRTGPWIPWMLLNFSFLYSRGKVFKFSKRARKNLKNDNLTNQFDLMIFISSYNCVENINKFAFSKTGFSIFRALKTVFTAVKLLGKTLNFVLTNVSEACVKNASCIVTLYGCRWCGPWRLIKIVPQVQRRSLPPVSGGW